MITKVCTRCNTEKPLSDFYFSKTINRYNAMCKPCRCLRGREAWASGKRKGTSIKRYESNEGRAQNLINNARYRAVSKSLPFALTTEWVKQQIDTGRCAVTGLPFDMGAGEGSGQGRAFGPSLDRKDSTLGYTLENTQAVCWLYNRAKGVQGHSEVMVLARALCLT